MTVAITQLKNLTSKKLRNRLIKATIGGFQDDFDENEKNAAFQEYVRRALPKIKIHSVQVINTTAALNSIAAYAEIAFNNRGKQEVFLKVHVESETLSLSPLGVKGEYENAQMLKDACWPVLTPLSKNISPKYPLLIYPKIDAESLFQKLEQSYLTGISKVTKKDLKLFQEVQKKIGTSTVKSITQISADKAKKAPVQNLFLARLKKGGRIDKWYNDKTLFVLPGIKQPVPWNFLKKMKWIINNENYPSTLEEIIEKTKKSLSFQGENKAVVALSHGDDHAGNILIDTNKNKIYIFDPAFAGYNPLSLCDTKAIAHTGFLPMAGMYYDPKLKNCQYALKGNVMHVSIDFSKTPIPKIHEQLAKNIIDSRIIPLMKSPILKDRSKKEIERFKCSLFVCAILTINIENLLKAKDGRGTGLLPMAFLLYELKGLPVLEKLKMKLHETP
ncbi:hypothetical protein HYV56_01950 [Candidatus Peregrinibacteria bacterium]|nr:hypothetical protein [Candidatus Peregrinibacteria bacterium]